MGRRMNIVNDQLTSLEKYKEKLASHAAKMARETVTSSPVVTKATEGGLVEQPAKSQVSSKQVLDIVQLKKDEHTQVWS